MPALMVQGCTSWAGKSLLTTALCRWFARQGVRVAPFKAQNMSNNARVVASERSSAASDAAGSKASERSSAASEAAGGAAGGEIGVAQWLQALAAGVEPTVAMNPVLVKPEATGSQVVRMGTVDQELSARPWRDRPPALWSTVEAALAGLLDTYELVLIEGAGSPAEINLAAHDIVNMRVAERADAPVLLTVDIDRGGAFAHLYGTWALLEQRHRNRVAGFVLNRFRGDASLLPPGPQRLAELTGVPTIGVLPMLDHDLPDEDGAASRTPRRGPPAGSARTPLVGAGSGLAGSTTAPDHAPVVAVVRYPTASNLDEFTKLAQVVELRWATAPWHLDGAQMVVLPGSKHVAADLAWLRTTGLDRAIRDAAAGGKSFAAGIPAGSGAGRSGWAGPEATDSAKGIPVLGICGGLQLLGTSLADPHGVDGGGAYGRGEALGLLPLATRFAAQKLVRQRPVRLPAELPAPWRPLAGREAPGYEIRHGRSALHGPVDAVAGEATDPLLVVRGNVAGWYPHGLLEDPDILERLFGARPGRTLDDTFNRLADAVDDHLDTALLRQLAGLP